MAALREQHSKALAESVQARRDVETMAQERAALIAGVAQLREQLGSTESVGEGVKAGSGIVQVVTLRCSYGSCLSLPSHPLPVRFLSVMGAVRQSRQ